MTGNYEMPNIKRRLPIIMVIGLLLSLAAGCGDTDTSSVETSEIESTEDNAAQSASEEASLELEQEPIEEAAAESEEVIIEVESDFGAMSLDAPDTWEIIEYDADNSFVTFAFKLDDKEHTVSIQDYSDEITFDGRAPGTSGYSELLKAIDGEYNISTSKSFCMVTENPTVLQVLGRSTQDDTVRNLCITEDASTLIKADSFEAYDEMTGYLVINDAELSVVSDTAMAQMAGFNFSYSDDTTLAKTDKSQGTNGTTSSQAENNSGSTNTNNPDTTDSSVSTVTGNTGYSDLKSLGPVPPGLYGFVSRADSTEPIDMTDWTTVITDNNPNWYIVKNGPGIVIRSSYPYIGKRFEKGDSYLIIHSTDKYGIPHQIEENGVMYETYPGNNIISVLINDDTGWDLIDIGCATLNGGTESWDFSIDMEQHTIFCSSTNAYVKYSLVEW